MTNATIKTNLESLLEILDAKANINIFKKTETGESLLRSTKVYRILSDDEALGAYGSYKVIGLTVVLGAISILIEEEV